MQSKRRSGRIAKEIAIVLLGTDTVGKVYSEETKTVVLSRHGAGVVSRYRFTPDEILTLRLPGTTKETTVRLVGQMGGEPGRYVYGLAFIDPDPDFWPIQFPPPEPYEPAIPRFLLECSFCGAREEVEQGDIEEDVYSVLGNVLRYCQECGTSTPWKKASGRLDHILAAAPTVAANSLTSPLPEAHSFESREPALPAPPVLPEPAYSGSFEPVFAAATSVLDPPERAIAMPAPPAEKTEPTSAQTPDASGRRVNRRKHMRIRVSFKACVRHPAHTDEVVECENVSKGGLCFRSQRQYSVDSLIEIAAPYSPGEPALFVPAQIKRVEALPGGQVFRYGAAYAKPASL